MNPHIIHGVDMGQGQVVGLTLAQHLGEVALGVYVQQLDFHSDQRKSYPQVVDSSAFTHTAILICYAYHLGFRRLWGLLFFHRFSSIRRNRRLCMDIK